MITDEIPHYSVMRQVVMDALLPGPGKTYVDGTLGAGGHTESILSASSPDGKVIAFELDPQAIQIATERLKSFSDRLKIIHDSYSSMSSYLDQNKPVDGILLILAFHPCKSTIPKEAFHFKKRVLWICDSIRINPYRHTRLLINIRKKNWHVFYSFMEKNVKAAKSQPEFVPSEKTNRFRPRQNWLIS